MQYFSNFETKFFKLFATVCIFQGSIIDYIFFNLYLFKVSLKSTFSLVFGTYWISIYSLLFEYRFPTLSRVWWWCWQVLHFFWHRHSLDIWLIPRQLKHTVGGRRLTNSNVPVVALIWTESISTRDMVDYSSGMIFSFLDDCSNYQKT